MYLVSVGLELRGVHSNLTTTATVMLCIKPRWATISCPVHIDVINETISLTHLIESILRFVGGYKIHTNMLRPTVRKVTHLDLVTRTAVN